jgi:phosphoribosyl-ATP pyrophosphohydrolase
MYRERIFQFMKTGEKTLFIPKNSGLYEYVIAMLPEIGIEAVDEIRKAKEGNRIARLGELEMTLARGEDIPKRVEEYTGTGKTAYGITGDDLFDEYVLREEWSGRRSSLIVLNTYDWYDEKAEFRKPALCLMNKTGKLKDIPEIPKIALNSKYERTSMNYISRIFGAVKTNLYSGDTEKTVSDNINDCCIEIVYKGGSRKDAGLEVVEHVRFTDIVLVGENPNYLGDAIMLDLGNVLWRKANAKEGSYTTGLLDSRKKWRDKLIIEAAEVVSAIESSKGLKEEISDLLYAVDVVIAGENIDIKQLADEIRRRAAKTGFEESEDRGD